jgi:hypothetical protein
MEQNNLKKYEQEYQDAPSNWIKFGRVGDWVAGTLVSVIEKKNDIMGVMQKIYELKVENGAYHDIKDKVVANDPTELNSESGNYLLGGKKIIDFQMRNIKIGQKVLVVYQSDYKLKGGMTAKTIKIKIGKMNEEFLKQKTRDEFKDATTGEPFDINSILE